MTRLLTYQEAAEASGLGEEFLRRAAAAGELVVHRFSHRTVRIDPEDLAAFQRQARVVEPTPADNRKSPAGRNPVEEAILRRRRRRNSKEDARC